jgi:hypothetical protein
MFQVAGWPLLHDAVVGNEIRNVVWQSPRFKALEAREPVTRTLSSRRRCPLIPRRQTTCRLPLLGRTPPVASRSRAPRVSRLTRHVRQARRRDRGRRCPSSFGTTATAAASSPCRPDLQRLLKRHRLGLEPPIQTTNGFEYRCKAMACRRFCRRPPGRVPASRGVGGSGAFPVSPPWHSNRFAPLLHPRDPRLLRRHQSSPYGRWRPIREKCPSAS